MLYIVPTRGRPQNADRLIKAWKDTRSFAELLIAVDDDDPELSNYQQMMYEHELPDWLHFRVGPRMRLGGTLNHYATDPDIQEAYGVIGFMGDDHVPVTHHWDAQIMDIFEKTDGTGVVYGNDLLQGENLPTAVAISTDIIKTLGYYVPPGATHLYLDNFWKHIGQILNRLVYLHGVIIEHVHPVAGKAQMDDQYREVNSGEMYQADEEVYRNWLNSGEGQRLLDWFNSR